MSTLPKVAVLGLGAMGHAFASNLLKKGFTVAGWNRSPARGEDLQAQGLSLHTTPQQAVADAEVIISMLADGQATLEVLAQIAPACQPQAISIVRWAPLACRRRRRLSPCYGRFSRR